jgi:predicted CopG family antitoxin
VELPADKVITLLDDVYEKLEKLAAGKTTEQENNEK